MSSFAMQLPGGPSPKFTLASTLLIVSLCVLLWGLMLSTTGCGSPQVSGTVTTETDEITVEVSGDTAGLCADLDVRKLPVGGFVCYDVEAGKVKACAVILGMEVCLPIGAS